MSRQMIGSDTDCATDISLEKLKQFVEEKNLDRIVLKNGPFFTCDFEFSDNTFYRATGFSVGYNGTGPQGLYKAVKMFYEKPFFRFDVISKMNRETDHTIDFIEKNIH